MSSINASRERIDIIRTYWATQDTGSRSKTTMRCNRMVLPLRNPRGEEYTVIRGKSITGTLRMGIALMDTFRLKGTLLPDEAVRQFSQAWTDSLGRYDTHFIKGNWISVYINGGIVYSTAESPDMDRIERLATGTVLNENLLDGASDSFADQGEEIFFSYDSQLALTLNNQEKYVKCSILERNLVNEGTMSFQFSRKPKARGTIIDTTNLAVTIVEASTLMRQHALIRKKMRSQTPEEQRAAQEQMEVVKSRVAELNTQMRAVLANNQVQFWPDEPKFILN